MALRAVVKNGHIVLDEPTALSEGTVLNLVADDEGDDLDDDERARLDGHLEASWDSLRAGRVRPAQEILNELRSRRR